jgi:hypothetical protein
MGIRAALRESFVGPPRSDFYGLAKHGRRVPSAELAVVAAALDQGGPIAERFVAQLSDAPDVWRLIAEDGSYELRVSTTLPVRGVPRAGWRSDPIPVRALPRYRPLEVELYASMAGIVEIHGRSLDGRPWPAEWSPAPQDVDEIHSRAPWMRLPTPEALRRERARAIDVIESWLGTVGFLRGKRGVVAVEPPATSESMASFEEGQRFDLPEAYRELLTVANGFEIGNLGLLGTDDAYRLDLPGPDRLVIVAPDEYGAFVLAPTGEVRFVELEDATSEGSVRAPDLRAWIRQHAGSHQARRAGS